MPNVTESVRLTESHWLSTGFKIEGLQFLFQIKIMTICNIIHCYACTLNFTHENTPNTFIISLYYRYFRVANKPCSYSITDTSS